ncbi:MAG: DcaP family trimeric outer membrane transporter [Bacteroidota bacterium]
MSSPIRAQTDDQDSTRAPRQPIGRFPDDAIVTRGSFDRSISINGTPGSFRIGGAVTVNANYDFDNFGFQQISFQPTIPLDGSSEDGEDQFGVHARLTRFNVDIRTPTKLGEARVFIEVDFFGATGNELVNDYTLRLRHAVAEIGNWKFGNFWSGFMDVFAQPETADPGGPLGLPSKRNPGLYYVHGEQSETSYGLGIENPTADLAGQLEFQRSESMPSIVGFFKWQNKWGYARVAAMTLQQRSTSSDNITGGINVTGRINLPFLHERDNLAFGFQAGEGFAHYYSSFAVGLDGIIRDNGDIDVTSIIGGYAAYQHWWTETIRSTFNASFFDFDLPSGFNPGAYAGGFRLGGNLVWTPVLDATFGLELNYDAVETFGGSEGSGLRLEFVSRFDF